MDDETAVKAKLTAAWRAAAARMVEAGYSPADVNETMVSVGRRSGTGRSRVPYVVLVGVAIAGVTALLLFSHLISDPSAIWQTLSGARNQTIEQQDALGRSLEEAERLNRDLAAARSEIEALKAEGARAQVSAEAVRVAKQYLSYFQGTVSHWQCADQRLLRGVIPENRLRIYDVRKVIETLADTGSVLEIRRHFGLGVVTALVRVEGRAVGVIANNPTHLAGAIDSDGADKAARFMQLCDAFDIPLLFLCDTPGMMVGPEVEKTALVRHCSRLFVIGANLTVPFFTIILRKGYGLGAQGMAGGSFKAPIFTVTWPTGEFGGMGLEGAVKLGYRKELAAEQDPAQRTALFDKMVAKAYEHGKGLNIASHFEIDDVIDPMESRRWILGALRSAPPVPPREGKKRPCIDTW